MNNKLAKAGAALFLVTIFSKIAAFLVTIVFSYYFGTDAITDAYYAGGTIPNLVNNSLTICALTLFIPVYTKCKSEVGEQKADELTSNVLNAFVIFNTILFAAVCITSPILSKLVAPGFDEEGLVHTRQMICYLSMSFPFTVAAVTLNNLCNANQRYIFPALLTLFNHVFIIVFNIILAPTLGIFSYPFICTGAWIVQLAILYFWSRGRLFKHKFIINLKDNYFRYMIKQSIPVMVTTAADQINLAADNIISSDLPGGSLSCLGYAHRIFNSINGIVTSTLLTIYYPILSRQYAEKDTKGLNSSLRRYFEIMLLLTLPVMMLLIGNSDGVIKILFNRGAMKENDIKKISILFIVYVSGLLFMSLKEFATRLFYIIGDTKQPTIINSICVVMNICLSLTFKHFWEIYGIAIATSVSTTICAVIECVFLAKKAGGVKAIKNHEIINKKNILQITIACLTAMVAMLLFQTFIPIYSNIISIIFSGMIYIVVAFVMLCLFKNEYTIIILKKINRGK